MQFPDGTVDDGEESPTIDICLSLGGDLAAEDVRALVFKLIEAADEVEGWLK